MTKLVVKRDPVHGFKFYANAPHIGMHELVAVGAELIMPRDGGFWLADIATGIRYRRVTMADLPKHVTWNTRGKGRWSQDDEVEDVA